MKIECPHCAFSKTVDKSMFPEDSKVNLSCPQCKKRFPVDTKQYGSDSEPLTKSDLPAVDRQNPPVVDTPPLQEPDIPQRQRTPIINQRPKPKPAVSLTKRIDPDSSQHLFVVNLIETLLNKVKSCWDQSFFDKNARWEELVGHYCVLLSAILGLMLGLFIAIRYDQLSPAGMGVGWLFAVLVLQYVAHKFVVTSDSLIESTKSQISSTAFLDSLSVLNILLGVASCGGGIYLAIKFSDWTFVTTGIFVCWAFACFASLSMNPQMLNIEIVGETTAGQEAVGLLSVFMKGMLKLVPIYFGTLMIIGLFQLINVTIALFSKNMLMFTMSATAASVSIFSALLLPLVAYIIFMFYYLAIDVIYAILVIPGKIDSSSKTEHEAA